LAVGELCLGVLGKNEFPGGSVMRTLKSVRCALLLLTALLGVLHTAGGQEVTAGITGTVVDPTGAAVKDAPVTATSTDRGTVWTAHTDDSGIFTITRIPVGSYSVSVEATGFEKAVYPTFTLTLNQTANIHFQLKVGSVSNTVEVTGAAPILQTQTTEVSTLIDANTNVSLPLASRNYLQLTLLAPGVTNVDPDGMRTPQDMLNSGRPYINGNREQANQYLIDGIQNSEDKNNETGYTPSVDAIQEFNLITQNASAEFGNYQGGIVSASIKSGTNNYHGVVYEFFRNDALDANLASSGWSQGVLSQENTPGHIVPGHAADGTLLKPELRYNQFGGAIGGPIIKNKLFFFADYQGQRLVNGGATGAQVLTAQARAGNFGQLCTDFGGTFNVAGICTGGVGTTQLKNPITGVAIPNNNLAAAGLAASPVATGFFGQTKNYPLPQVNSLNGNNIFYNSGNDLNNNQGDVKVDYNVSGRDHIFGRWSQMDLNQPTFTGCVFCFSGAVEGSDQPVRNAALDWTHTFSNNLLNEARVGFNAVDFDQTETPTSSLGNISQTLGINGGNLQAPGLVELDISPSGAGALPSLGLRNLIQVFHTTQIQAEDNLVIIHGRHQFKTGFQYTRQRQDYVYQGNNGALGFLNIDTLTGSGLADFYLGNVASQSLRDTGGVITSPAMLRGNVYGAYGQDDWRITDTLTLNLGVRFEDHTPLYEAHNRAVNFGLKTGTVYTPTGIDGTAKFGNQALYNNYLGIGDWMPRVGFAWSPSSFNGTLVVRGSFGISTFTEGGGSNEELTLNLPYGILQQTAPVGVGTITQGFGPTPPSPCPVINQTCYNGIRVRIYDQNFKPAMINQWNLSIQKQLSNSLTFQLGYVGQHGAHLLNFQDEAQSIPLNAQGKIAGAGDPIVKLLPGPNLGGGTPGSLYLADNPQFNPAGCGTTVNSNPPCGHEALAGTNMSNSDQEYNALQAVLQKRMSNGLQGQLAYTWSKCLSNSPGYFGTGFGSTNATSSGGQPGFSNIYNPRLNWGPCYYDQRNIFTSYVTYQLPFGRGKQFGHDMNKFVNGVIGNWEVGGIVTVHSGNQLTLNEFGGWGLGGNADNTNGVNPYTLAGLPNCNGPIYTPYKRVNATSTTPAYIQYFDTTNISNPLTGAELQAQGIAGATGSFGTCHVGNIRGPAYANFDFSLHKGFPITEGTRLEFRFEALNAFNHPVWTFSGGPANGSFDPGAPGTGANTGVPSSNPNFGHITGSQGARELQFALKFYF
jgi:hypothetical protein